MLTGKFPLDFPKNRDPLLVILQDPIISIRKRNPNLPQALAEVIDKAVAKEPGKRYQDAGEMLTALKKAL
jgi:serine/threonine protein kinase